jgi:SAM-dependent methyltransferase
MVTTGRRDRDPRARAPRFLEPGSHTAVGRIVAYRLDKLAARGLIRGVWLDCGCAEGGYTVALAERGADRVVGIDVNEKDIRRAEAREHASSVSFRPASAEALPFADASFDGVLLNEVLEHVADEEQTLREIRRVLRPGGHLALFSPNRWFPFEGHGVRIDSRRSLDVPVPLLPWLPARLTRRVMRARNYWPHELRRLVRKQGFEVVEVAWALPLFEVYRWLPRALVERYWRMLPRLERTPGVRRVGVSTLILARRN